MADEEQIAWDQPAEQVSWDQPTVSQRQRAFLEQIRMGEPKQAAQISYGGEKLAAPMPEVEQPKTGMFLGTDEQGRPVAVEQPITGGEKPQGILERMSQAAKAGLGEEPFGISPETQKKYPWASTLQLAAYPADVLLRGLNAFVAGGAGAVAGAAEEMGMSPAMASRLQRDIYQAAQVAAVEMPKPTPGMMTRPIVRAAEAAAPTVETVEMMTGKPPVPKGPAIELPTIPVAEGAPVPEVRGKGARLLPPETPHEPIKLPEPAAELPSRAGVGAEAAAGPLEGISPETINQVARQLKADNWTPWTIDERLEKMSPHQFLAEVSPTLENKAAEVASYGGEGRNTIKTNVDQRHTEVKPRLKFVYDEGFGPVENLAQERRVLDIEQAKAADPLYQKFRDLQIHPTEKLKELSELFEKKGVFAEAKDIAEWQRVPWEENFFTPGKKKTYPTAQSWDLVKQALDAKIEGSFVDGRPTKWTRIYTQAKNDLINAIDNHPNPEIAGVWKEARAAYAEPASIKTAYDFGKKLLSDAVDANEVPFFTAAHSSKEMSAIAAGIRYDLENKLGRAGAQEGRSIRQILSDNAQNKIRWIIKDEKAEKFFNAVDLENQIHGAQKRLIGGGHAAKRMLGAAEEFGTKPPRGAEVAGQIAETGMGLIKDTKRTVTKAVSKFATEKMARAAEEKAAQLRAEIARIYILQGPERDAALRWILEHGENWTGAPEVKLPGMRSSGGSVLDKMHAAKRRADGGGLEDGPFDEAGVQHTAEGYPYIQAGDVVEAQAAREAAARQIAGGIKGKPYEPTPPSTEGKTWIMEPGKEAVQSGYAEPFFHLPENTVVNEAGEIYNKETGEPLSIVRRPNVIPLAKTPEGIQWAMPKMLELAGDVMNPLAVTRGVPVKAGEMVLGAGPVKTVPEGGVLGAMQAAKTERELSPLGFYSHGAEAATALPQAKGTPEQMRGMLERAGVKPAELEGFNEAFAGRPSVTREEVAQHFRQAMPQVEETVLGDIKQKMNQKSKYNIPEVRRAANQASETPDDLLLTLENDGDSYRALMRRFPELRNNENWAEIVTRDIFGGTSKPAGTTKFQQYTLPGGKNYREIALTLPGDELYRAPSSHSMGNKADINRLAHIRMADRTGPNGEKMLHVEEMQSDWGQKGRKEGFKVPEKVREELEKQLQELVAERAKLVGSRDPAERARYEQISKQEAEILDKYNKFVHDAVPSAPYVTSTQGWTDLALKRVLKEAAEGGYDKVVFTPGAEQAARYNLSKHVDTLSWDPKTNELRAFKGDEPVIQNKIVPKEKLAENVGKEVAERLVNSKPTQIGWHMLEGQDLSVGGEGMRSYYDKIVPTQINKLIGKYDKSAKAKLHDMKLPTKEGGTTRGHVIEITPKMREAIMAGQAAFAHGGSVLHKMMEARRG